MGLVSFPEESSCKKTDISVILPLIVAPVHTLDTQYHYMKIVEKTTQLLNLGEICVDESDQLVYNLLKELQWRFPDRFGPEKYFGLSGSLHTEKSTLLLCGSLIEESSLDKVMASCGLSIVGTEFLVSVNYVLTINIRNKENGDKGPVLQCLKNQESEEREMCHHWS